MTDKAFQKLLDDLAKANIKYKELLDKAENEVIKRFGTSPGEVDYDYWIDTFHIGVGRISVEQLTKDMNDILSR